MKKHADIIGWSSLLFWMTLSVILFCLLPYFKNAFYNDDVDRYWVERLTTLPSLEPVVPVSPQPSPDVPKIFVNWAWRDFKGAQHEIQFYVERLDSAQAVSFRQAYQLITKEKLYRDFIEISSAPIEAMAQAMSEDIERKNLRGQDALDYVVTAIQTPNYTKVTNIIECPCTIKGHHWVDDCFPRRDGRGCCNDVVPYGIYTPTEFIIQKTGDCDTKSLIAYALLKKLGYNAAVIVGLTGKDGRHAMLALNGVAPVIPSEYVRKNGRIYYPWEVTDFASNYRLGNMRMWNRWRDWKVICN